MTVKELRKLLKTFNPHAEVRFHYSPSTFEEWDCDFKSQENYGCFPASVSLTLVPKESGKGWSDDV